MMTESLIQSDIQVLETSSTVQDDECESIFAVDVSVNKKMTADTTVSGFGMTEVEEFEEIDSTMSNALSRDVHQRQPSSPVKVLKCRLPKDMKTFALGILGEHNNNYERIGKKLKKKFNEYYGHQWGCVVGSAETLVLSDIEESSLFVAQVGPVKIVLYRSGQLTEEMLLNDALKSNVNSVVIKCDMPDATKLQCLQIIERFGDKKSFSELRDHISEQLGKIYHMPWQCCVSTSYFADNIVAIPGTYLSVQRGPLIVTVFKTSPLNQQATNFVNRNVFALKGTDSFGAIEDSANSPNQPTMYLRIFLALVLAIIAIALPYCYTLYLPKTGEKYKPNFQDEEANSRSEWHQLGTRSFRVVAAKDTFEEAESVCVYLGGHLASIHSELESNFVLDIAKKKADIENNVFWIGGFANPSSLPQWMRRMANSFGGKTKLQWTDGSNWDYKHSSMRNTPLPEPWEYKCWSIAYDFKAEPPLSTWNAYDCIDKLNYICARDALTKS